MRVAELLGSDVLCLHQDDVVQTAAQKMRSENVGFLPVCDFENRVVGVVTDRDLVVRVVANDSPPSTRRIYECMTEKPVTVRPDENVELAAELMAHHRVSRLPVVDFEGVLLGVVSLADVAAHGYAGEALAALGDITRRKPRAELPH